MASVALAISSAAWARRATSSATACGAWSGLLVQQPAADGSAYHDYVLTAAGQDLFPLLVALRQWGERHCFAAGEAHSQLIESSSRRPLPYMQPHGRDGQPVRAADTRVRKLKGEGGRA